jgi:hypothetical protein
MLNLGIERFAIQSKSGFRGFPVSDENDWIGVDDDLSSLIEREKYVKEELNLKGNRVPLHNYGRPLRMGREEKK